LAGFVLLIFFLESCFDLLSRELQLIVYGEKCCGFGFGWEIFLVALREDHPPYVAVPEASCWLMHHP
jgi:hypothetical protein